MKVPHRALNPALFPGLCKIRVKPFPPVEFPWMVAFGWFEISDPERPGWRAICETVEDVSTVLSQCPIRIYRLIRRGPAGVAFRAIARWDVARGPSSGRLAFCRLDQDRREGQ
jgi:hypothetical protein